MKLKLWFPGVLAAFMAGCATPPTQVSPHALKVTVDTFTGTGVAAAMNAPPSATNTAAALPLSPSAAEIAALAPPRRFAMLSLPSSDAAADEQLREIFAVRLKFKGYQQDDGAPQLLFTCAHSISTAVESLPERRDQERIYVEPYSETITSVVNGSPVVTVKDVPGHWKMETEVKPATTRPVFIKKIMVKAFNADASPQLSPTAIPIWDGEISNTNPSQDLLGIAPLMLRELSEEIPSPSGKTETRFVEP